ncbi:MAG: hypothetical protein ACLQHF_17975 [Terracidiphilus sp.]
MKKSLLIVAATWLAGVILYVVLSGVIARVFVNGMLYWAHQTGASKFLEYELRSLHAPLFMLCILWGALYASALAKPEDFGGTPRVLRRLAWTYVLALAGCFLSAVIVFVPYPNFGSNLALSVYPGVILILSVLCFVLAIGAWIRLAFS